MPSSGAEKLKGSTIAAAVVVGFAAGAAGVGIAHLLHARPRKKASRPKVTVLVVNLAFASPEDLTSWVRWWTPLAHTVYVRDGT